MATKRKTTPDVLSSVLGTSPPAPATEPESKAPAVQAEEKAPAKARTPRGQGRGARKKPAEAKPEPARSAVEVDKQKATFSVSQNVLEGLEDTWMKLRRMSRRRKGTVTKSEIVEVALQAALEDFESRGKESGLAKTVLE